MLHPTAIIDSRAKLDGSVSVGPYAVIDGPVEIGPGCVIGPHVHITGHTRIGAHNRFFTGAVIGEAPQDLKYTGEPSGLRIGDYNTFREHVTVHRANHAGSETIIGSKVLLMAHCHIAHDCQLGNGIIIANGALLGGHVVVDDRALISGNCLLHQFVHVGTLAIMQGGSAISKDLPPYTIARGDNGICGLNTVGLRRAAISSADRIELRKLYHFVFRGDLNIRDAAAEAQKQFHGPMARTMLEFIANSKRGVCADVRRKSEPDEEEE